MDLVGIEFQEFATFPKMFVKLDAPMNVIAGRNNAGKTALLRGLTALNRVRGNSQVFGEPERYCTKRNNSIFLVAKVFFRVFADDAATDHHFAAAVNPYLGNRGGILECDVLIFPGVGFGSCNLIVDEKTIPVASRAPSGQLILNIVGGNPIVVGGNRQEVAGQQYWSNTAPFLMKTFGSLPDLMLVDAHRNIQHNTQIVPQKTLLPDGNNLANFLATLQSSERPLFQEIEAFVLAVFPEFSAVNPEMYENTRTVAITLTERATREKIPLTHCGTGVEQLLVLTSFVVASEQPKLILLDEPHSYLHPDAERQLIAFLRRNRRHKYVIATHSPVIVNSVAPEAITYVERGKSCEFSSQNKLAIGDLLKSLGYRNADFLFHNRIIFVEGDSDQAIIPKLLEKRLGSAIEIACTGFPLMHGVPGAGKPASPRKNIDRIQSMILDCEKFLNQFGRTNVPHLFLFDGDFLTAEKAQLQQTSFLGKSLPVTFLPRTEIENYLMESKAIAAGITKQLAVFGQAREASESDVEAQLNLILASDDTELWPLGKTPDPYRSVKGSAVLKRIYEQFRLEYRKAIDGPLIAESVSPENSTLEEIWNALDGLFS